MPVTPLRILVLDDHRDTLDILGVFLGLLGHRSELVVDPALVFGIACGETFDVLLTDVHMPGTDAWEVVQQLRQRECLPPVVISMSAGLAEQEAERSKANGCRVHLRKPLRLNQLEEALAAPLPAAAG